MSGQRPSARGVLYTRGYYSEGGYYMPDYTVDHLDGEGKKVLTPRNSTLALALTSLQRGTNPPSEGRAALRS